MECPDESAHNTVSRKQVNSLNLFCGQLSEALNLAGLDMPTVLKPGYKIWWTKHSVKELIWRPIQRAIYGKESTLDLRRREEASKIHEQIMHMLGEKHGLEYIDFPHKIYAQDTIKKEDPATEPNVAQEP